MAVREVETEICGKTTLKTNTAPVYTYVKEDTVKIEAVSFFKPFSATCGYTNVGVDTFDGTNYVPYTDADVVFTTDNPITDEQQKISIDISVARKKKTFFARITDSLGFVHR